MSHRLHRDPVDRILGELSPHASWALMAAIEHHDADIATHVLAVARLSWKLGRGLPLRHEAMIRGALLHDYFLYDWRREKPPFGGRHAWAHPRVALRNALRDFGPLSRIERDCIRHHMWPLSLVPPLSIEAWIVCLSDKAVAVREVFLMLFGPGHRA